MNTPVPKGQRLIDSPYVRYLEEPKSEAVSTEVISQGRGEGAGAAAGGVVV